MIERLKEKLKKKRRRASNRTNPAGCAQSAVREWLSMLTGTPAESAGTRSGRRRAQRLMILQRRNRKPVLTAKALSYAVFYLLIISMLLAVWAFQAGYIDEDSANYIMTTILSLILPAFALSYMFYRGKSTKEIVSSLGLTRDRISLFMLAIGFIVFVQLFALEIIVTLFSTVANVQINTNVATLFQAAPSWFYVFTAIIGPIDEEVFFRGFLVPRVGIVISAVFFAILHAGYNSTFGIEIIAAFVFGTIAGYAFKKTDSLYPSIVAHILVNSLTLLTGIVVL